ncbi:MAG: HD domain-containing protein [Bacteroidota bacterium]
MDNLIDIWISHAEKNWLETLHNHAEDLFSTTFLPSHDHHHHRRVWNICRNLLREIATFNTLMDESLVEGVLIAACFHDLGMVHSTQEDHGHLGREICETYFKKSTIHPPSRFVEILSAIEQHDIKEKKIYSGIHPDTSPGILDILSIADDLEALGVIGIYRYTEIYLKRNVTLHNLGIRILGNATARFKNISESCTNCPLLIREYHRQYSDLVSFFDSYNQQLLIERDPGEVYYGHIGVVNYIRTLSVEGETRPENFLRKVGVNNPGTIITNFFTSLHHELDQARL